MMRRVLRHACPERPLPPASRKAFIWRLAMDSNDAVRRTFRHAFACAPAALRILGDGRHYTGRCSANRDTNGTCYDALPLTLGFGSRPSGDHGAAGCDEPTELVAEAVSEMTATPRRP